MSTWRRDNEDSPVDFGTLLYKEECSSEEEKSDIIMKFECDEDYKVELLRLSLAQQERTAQVKEEAPSRATSRDRSRSPIASYSSESVPPSAHVLRQTFHDNDVLVKTEDDDERVASATHNGRVSSTERDRNERNRGSVNERRGVQGSRYPNRGHRRHKWKSGDPLKEIWSSDQNVPPEFVSFTTDVLRKRQMSIRDVASDERSSQRENASESESDDESLDAFDGMDGPTRQQIQNLFEWFSMESFHGQEENFKPKHTGSTDVFTSTYEAFRAYWSDDVLGLIAAQTNIYATKITSNSFQSDWFPTNVHEILCLFSFWIMVGIVKMPTITSCFSVDPLLNTEVFRRIFTRKRYEILNKVLHFVSDPDVNTSSGSSNSGDRSSDRLLRMKPIIDHLNSSFQSNYVLSKDICFLL